MQVDVTCQDPNCSRQFAYEWTKPKRGGQTRRFCDDCVRERRKRWRSYTPVVRTLRCCSVCGDEFSPYKESSRQSECSVGCRESRRAAERKSTEHWRIDRLRRWGISQAEYDELLRWQAYSCAICGGHFQEVGALVIDHDHGHCAGKTGCRDCIRGLLCGHCNRGLGFFRDNWFALQRACEYVASASSRRHVS